MGKYLLPLLLPCLSTPLFGIGEVRFGTPEDNIERFVAVEASSNGSEYFTLVTSRPLSAGFTEYGTTPSGAASAYCPIDDGTTKNHVFTRYSNLVPNLENGTSTLRFFLAVDNSREGSDEAAFLYAAARRRDENRYIVVARSVRSFSAGQRANQVGITLEMSELCDMNAVDCGSFSNGGMNDQATVQIYFFLAPQSEYSVRNDIDIDDDINSGGVYLNLYLSDALINEDAVSIANLAPGDEQIIISYRKNRINDFHDMRILYQTETEGKLVPGSPVGPYLAANVSYDVAEDVTIDQRRGVIRARGLKNNVDYYIGIVATNRYLISSKVATTDDNDYITPLGALEVLSLEGDAPCYILSAGFGEEHFIVDYFRFLRDHLLAPTAPGQALIRLYYHWAPPWALFIKKHPLLAFTLRLLILGLFFLLNLSLITIGLWLILLGVKRIHPTGNIYGRPL